MALNPLKEFCELVSGVAVPNATSLRDTFSSLASSHSILCDSEYLLKIFAFMNFTVAQGVWSNLPNAKLRKDLLIELKGVLIQDLARQVAASDTPDQIPAQSVTIMFDDFPLYMTGYKHRIEETGYGDAGVARLFALEQIQKRCGLSDAVMNEIVPKLWADEKMNSEVELIALQINKVDNEPKSFLGRLFRG